MKPPGEYLAAHLLPGVKRWPDDERRRLIVVLAGLAAAIRRYYGQPLYDEESGHHIGKEMPLHEVKQCAFDWLRMLREPHPLTLAPQINSLHLRPEVRRAVVLLDSLSRSPDFALLTAHELEELHRLAGLQKTHRVRREGSAKSQSVDECVALANQLKRENPQWNASKIARYIPDKLSTPDSEITPKTVRNRLKIKR